MDPTFNIPNSCPGSLTGPASQMFMALINTLITSQCLLEAKHHYPADYSLNLRNGDEFDFIVVGSGSAGSLVAARLSENPNWNVLLLEAGEYPSPTTEIPSVYNSHAKTSMDWNYAIESSATDYLGLKNKSCSGTRGKALGGTSSLNSMVYVRGNRKDFDTWAEYGNPEWDYDSILKYYKKFEGLEADDEHIGKDGDLKLSHYTSDQPVRKILIDAYNELGYGKYTEENPIGYVDAYTTISNGTRSNTAKAFLSKAKERKNLHVALNAHVSKLLLAGHQAVVGVEVRINNKLLQLKSSKEVILSAGTINSPQILMNSGIGPEKHLKELSIPLVKNLKVGENLQDHIFFGGLFINIAEDALSPKTVESVTDDWYQYFMHRKGPISRSGMENFLFFLNSKHNSAYPNLELFYVPIYRNNFLGTLSQFQNSLNMPDEVIKVENDNNRNSHNLLLVPMISYPKSTGKILLRSANPFEAPKIFTNYFSDANDEDIQVILDGIRFYQKVIQTKAFLPYNPQLVHLDVINCREFKPDSDDYWKCTLRNIATTAHHLVGTCKMGPETDPEAVVDSRLRVHGIKGIRVIDGSIMPKIVSCNTNAPIIMIGEKGADMVKQDWSQERVEL